MKRFDGDRYGNVDSRQAARAAMTVADAIQDLPAEEQVAGLACAFKLCAERYGLNVPDTLTVSGNIINTVDGKRPEFRALAEYMEKEW